MSLFSRRPDAKWIDPGQADEVSEMIVLTDVPWLSEMESRHKSPLLGSLSVLVDVFAAWVTTEWLGISNGEELIKNGWFGNALVRRSLALASSDAREESAKIKHERENDACVGGLRNPNMAFARNISLRQLGARLREVIDGIITENP